MRVHEAMREDSIITITFLCYGIADPILGLSLEYWGKSAERYRC
jgi:hypothetical protein